MMNLLSRLKIAAFVFLSMGASAVMSQTDLTPGYNVGVFYFPGWKNDAPGAPSKRPWDPIKKYPGKEPLLGWYDEGDPEVTRQQIDQMKRAGIDFVAFDWYWSEGSKPYLEHAVPSFLKSPNWTGMKFSFLWANHMKVPNSVDNFTDMMKYLGKYYFNRSDYLKIDGRPVFFVFSQQNLRDQAKALGKHPKDLLAMARSIAKSQGFPDLYIVGSAEAVNYWVTDYGRETGYDAYSAYNYHRGFEGKYIPTRPLSHSFDELSDGYLMSWNWIIKNSPVPYIVPGTAGWNKGPWGGSLDPLHDKSEASPAGFEDHLRRIKKTIDANPDKTLRTTVLCCWNEHGEGSVIEPTKDYGNSRINSILKVFGQTK